MKIKKDGVIINLTESDLKKLGKALLSEQSYAGGLIQGGDSLCEILCGRKLAKIGAKDAQGVGIIQNAFNSGKSTLDPTGTKYNESKGGGGMSAKCGTSEDACDDWFDKHTRDATIEFQNHWNETKTPKLTVDGIVGAKTLQAMIDAGLLELECNCDQTAGGGDDKEDGGEQGKGDDRIWDGTDWTIQDLLAIDCDKLKNCLIELLQNQQWENIIGTDFMTLLIKCIGVGSSTTKTIEQPIPKNNRGKKCGDCPQSINAVEWDQLKDSENRANSEKYQWIKRCMTAGCTKIVGGAAGAGGATGVAR